MREGLTETFKFRLKCRKSTLLTVKLPVVQLLLAKANCDNLHDSTEYVGDILEHVFRVVGLQNAQQKIKSRSIKYIYRNANPNHPPMVDLPRERLDEHLFPCTHTGGGYFGPIKVKFLRRTLKNIINNNNNNNKINKKNNINKNSNIKIKMIMIMFMVSVIIIIVIIFRTIPIILVKTFYMFFPSVANGSVLNQIQNFVEQNLTTKKTKSRRPSTLQVLLLLEVEF